MRQEMSYVDLLSKLQHDIEQDTIPTKEKKLALNLIAKLQDMLWQYSA